MWNLVHLVCTISVLIFCPLQQTCHLLQQQQGFTLWPDQFGSVLLKDLSWIPCYSIRASLCCIHRKPWTKVLFLTLGDNTPWESREEGERDGPKRTLWLPQVAVKMDHSHWGHTLLWSMQWFHLLLEGEGRLNTQSTDQILRLQRTSACFLEIFSSGQIYRSTETGKAKSGKKNKGKKEDTAKWSVRAEDNEKQ